jgi:hypothetical protein
VWLLVGTLLLLLLLVVVVKVEGSVGLPLV